MEVREGSWICVQSCVCLSSLGRLSCLPQDYKVLCTTQTSTDETLFCPFLCVNRMKPDLSICPVVVPHNCPTLSSFQSELMDSRLPAAVAWRQK